MKYFLGLMIVSGLFLVSCNKTEITRVQNVVSLDMSTASDSLGKATYNGMIIRTQAEFDTLMMMTGDTFSFPGLQGTEVLLICSQKVQNGIDAWAEVYSITEKKKGTTYAFKYMTSERPDYIYGLWTTLAVIVDLGDQNPEISFYEEYRGN